MVLPGVTSRPPTELAHVSEPRCDDERGIPGVTQSPGRMALSGGIPDRPLLLPGLGGGTPAEAVEAVRAPARRRQPRPAVLREPLRRAAEAAGSVGQPPPAR